ncbi:hypothetical protein [Streptomyces sp. NPDC013740]|uniref:hypothetical protein n=1 Tax=Streptomyces sp. NPDC013740 TaxID=3364867 RepID=UPI00370331FB
MPAHPRAQGAGEPWPGRSKGIDPCGSWPHLPLQPTVLEFGIRYEWMMVDFWGRVAQRER